MGEYKTWKERILFVMSDRKWKTRKQINSGLGLKYGRGGNYITLAVNSYLLRLIRTGHVERAIVPPEFKSNPLDNRKYVYRWTGKAFSHKCSLKHHKFCKHHGEAQNRHKAKYGNK